MDTTTNQVHATGAQDGRLAGTDRATVVVVDDDSELRQLISTHLREAGYHVLCADGAGELDRHIAREKVDLVILDVMMPGRDGLSIAGELADRHACGIIMLSALGTENDRVLGLELGADDYLAKPVSPRELLARVHSLLRRRRTLEHRGAPSCYEFSGWRLDPVHRSLHDPGGVVISLSEGEFRLLLVFLEHPEKVMSRDSLLELARGSDSDAFDRAIDTQVSRLRRKLLSRAPGELIRTVRNEGYIFVSPVWRG